MFQKIIILFLLCIVYKTSHCQTNSLVIFSEDGTPFYLTLNSERINKNAETNVKVNDLGWGWHRIKIDIPGIVKEPRLIDSILLSDKSKHINKEFTYVLIKKADKLELQFKSISDPSGPSSPIIPEAPKETAPIIDNSIYGNLYKTVNKKPLFFENYDAETQICKVVLTDKDILYAKNLIINSNDRVSAHQCINEIIQKNKYTVNQLSELLLLEPIDMDRLNNAKAAYEHIVDIENINNLLPIFKYPAMKESFENFIQEQKNVSNQKKLHCTTPISEGDFNKLTLKLKNTSYDNEKLIVAKKELSNSCLSSEQIKKISSQFTHDREKLEFIKYALTILTDKSNKLSLADEFQYQGTKDEYLKYINSQP